MTQCSSHPRIERDLERMDAQIDSLLEKINENAIASARIEGLIKSIATEVMGLRGEINGWKDDLEKRWSIIQRETDRRLAVVESQTVELGENTESQTREALEVRAKRAEQYVERLAEELRAERVKSSGRKVPSHGKKPQGDAKWKFYTAVGLAMVSSMTALAQFVLTR